MLDKLSDTLKSGIKKITNAIFVDKKLIDGIIKDIQRALIEADVNVELVFKISQKIRQIAVREDIKGIEKKEQLIKLIHDEILALLGSGKEIKIGKKTKILFLGLYGSGKTTTIAKLGFYYAKRGKKVACLGLDTQRPAAMHQLEQMAEKARISVFIDKKEKSPEKIYNNYKKELDKYNLVLIDTSGRDALNFELTKEIKFLEKLIKPDYRILVMPADIGQSARIQASEFQKALSIDGVIITRMDGTAKAGGALTACAETNAPVFFIGTGEKIQDLEVFNPESFISRLLGLGDIQGLLEKVKSATTEEQEKRIQKSLTEGKLTLKDIASQLESMNQIGSFDKLLGMIPGLSSAKIPEEKLKQHQEKTKHWKYAISSMTPEEIENPELLEKQTSRIARIAKGSGTTTSEIRELLKQYKLLNEMVRSQSSFEEGKLDSKMLQKMAKKFKGKIKF